MLATGWVKVGRQVLRTSSGSIAVPGRSAPRPLVDCDVWVQSEPTVPVSVIAQATAHCMSSGHDITTLDALCNAVFGLKAVDFLGAVGLEISAAETVQ